MKKCETLTLAEYKEHYSPQPEGQVFCNRCEEEGRVGLQRHVRERKGQPCPCCRRKYQKRYYGRSATAATTGLASKIDGVEAFKERIQVWYNTSDPDIMQEIREKYLPELNRVEESLGLRPTQLVEIRQKFLADLYARYPDLEKKVHENHLDRLVAESELHAEALGQVARRDEAKANRVEQALRSQRARQEAAHLGGPNPRVEAALRDDREGLDWKEDEPVPSLGPPKQGSVPFDIDPDDEAMYAALEAEAAKYQNRKG